MQTPIEVTIRTEKRIEACGVRISHSRSVETSSSASKVVLTTQIVWQDCGTDDEELRSIAVLGYN